MGRLFKNTLMSIALLLGFTVFSLVYSETSAYAASDSAASVEEYKSKLENALQNRVTSFSIEYTGGSLSTEALKGMISDILNSDDYLMYSLKSYSYSGTSKTVNYTFSYWESLDQTNAVSAKVTEVLSTIITPNMNDFQKEKAIHDWIETNVSYDTTLVQHSAYAGLFGNKKTVCQGYALITYKMLKEAGIENKIVEGMAGATPHAWNIVKIDGIWYHLDTTWDDPVPDIAGRVIFDHFNLTDNQIKAVHTWTKIYPSATTSFETTLNDKIITDAVNAPFYQELKGLIDSQYSQPEYTVNNSIELAAKIQNAISTHQPTFKVRHTNKAAAFTDLKAAISGFSNISSYRYEISDYLRSESLTDGILTVSLNYSDPIAVTGITLKPTNTNVQIAGTLTLAPSIEPVNASIKNVTWTSSDTNIATVSATGVVTGKAVGTVTITATTVDGGKKAESTITVLQPVTSIALNKTALTFKVGDPDFKLEATVGPNNASDKSLTWTSSNPSVATVDANGVVHAVASGSTTITAKSVLGNAVATSAVTVAYNVSSISLNKPSLTVNIGTPSTLTATISPTNATNKNVTWTSSDTNIATVSATGVVTGKAVGTATITATTVDGGKKAESTITVLQPVTSIVLNKTALTFKVGDPDFKLEATVGPNNASDKSLTWTSSNPSVATVDANGVVHAVASGSATITAKSLLGNAVATSAVTVAYDVSSISLNKSSLTVNIGTPSALTATISPTNATNKNVTWTSSDTNIATVSATGVVTGKAVGTVTITATTVDGGKKAESTITVLQPVTSITLNKTALTLKVGDPDFKLEATVGPINASDKSLTWTSSNPSVATVDANGVVHAVASGKTTITAKSVLGNAVATSAVTVSIPVSNVTLNTTNLTIGINKTFSLIATVEPVLATTKSVTWTSSDTKIATVSSTGIITAKSIGTATITVTTTDGAKTATVTVTVTN
ncbi:Ig-like domain-containing protein [Gottfriedia luciferensis]|uniref:Ig-like domain-containing protein n=1 Tax=Gottfriedia luciferensis TaxID=178774 RepID=UPI001302BD20|nr:Ig-like domain-containing protein [Gottfriedia luciferensis]